MRKCIENAIGGDGERSLDDFDADSSDGVGIVDQDIPSLFEKSQEKVMVTVMARYGSKVCSYLEQRMFEY